MRFTHREQDSVSLRLDDDRAHWAGWIPPGGGTVRSSLSREASWDDRYQAHFRGRSVGQMVRSLANCLLSGMAWARVGSLDR